MENERAGLYLSLSLVFLLCIVLLLGLITLQKEEVYYSPESSVIRTISSNEVYIGEELSVTLEIIVGENDSSYTIEESIPEGFTVLDTGGADTSEQGILKWSVVEGATSTSYTYTLEASQLGEDYFFEGSNKFDGEETISTEGDLLVDVIEEIIEEENNETEIEEIQSNETISPETENNSTESNDTINQETTDSSTESNETEEEEIIEEEEEVIEEEEIIEETPIVVTPQPITYTPSEEDFSNGYSKSLAPKDKIKINLNSQEHTITVSNVFGNDFVEIVIESDPIIDAMFIGETKKFDINKDGVYDLQISLNTITNGNADITILNINEAIPQESPEKEEEIVEINLTEEETSTPPETTDEDLKKPINMKLIWIWVSVGIAFLFLVWVALAVAASKKNKQPDKNKTQKPKSIWNIFSSKNKK